MRAYLIAYALTASHSRATAVAKVAHDTPRKWERAGDPAYLEALAEAEDCIAARLEDEARRRAVDGSRSYKFTKDGTALRHPELCDCEHDRKAHARAEDGEQRVACTLCSCAKFTPAPYFEHAYSDRLLELLLKAQRPEKYGDRLNLKGVLGTLDMGRLPDELVARIAAGDDPVQVVLSAGSAAVRQLARGIEMGAPGAVDAQEPPPDDGAGAPGDAGA